MNPSITSGQKKQYEKFIGDTAEKALRGVGLDKDGLQRVFERGDKLQSVIMSTLKELSTPSFSLLHAFGFKVPKNYDHFTQLKTFREKHHGEFDSFNPNLTDKNFARVTDRLVPGKTYLAQFFVSTRNKELSHQKDCLPFLKSQDASLCGAQGISLAWECAKKEFPNGHYWCSLDKKSALWKLNFDGFLQPMIPSIGVGNGHKNFIFSPFSNENVDGVNLFCLTEQAELSRGPFVSFTCG